MPRVEIIQVCLHKKLFTNWWIKNEYQTFNLMLNTLKDVISLKVCVPISKRNYLNNIAHQSPSGLPTYLNVCQLGGTIAMYVERRTLCTFHSFYIRPRPSLIDKEMVFSNRHLHLYWFLLCGNWESLYQIF